MKFLQSTLANTLQIIYGPKTPDCVHGFVPSHVLQGEKRYVISNAKAHLGKRYLANLDIDNFFPSIDSVWLMDCFRSWVPDIPQDTLELLVHLCSYKNGLPLGAPSSAVLSNMILYPLDLELEDFTAQEGISYTRYVDDMSFSTDKETLESQIPEIINRIQKHGFEINVEKRRLFGPKEPKVVTGLILDGEKITVQKELLKNINRCIKDYGQLKWLSRQVEMEKKWIQYKVRHLEQSINGQLAFLQQVNGAEDPVYVKLNNKFRKTLDKKPPSFDFYF